MLCDTFFVFKCLLFFSFSFLTRSSKFFCGFRCQLDSCWSNLRCFCGLPGLSYQPHGGLFLRVLGCSLGYQGFDPEKYPRPAK